MEIERGSGELLVNAEMHRTRDWWNESPRVVIRHDLVIEDQYVLALAPVLLLSLSSLPWTGVRAD